MHKIFIFLFFTISLFSSEIKCLEKGYLIVALKYDKNPMSYLAQDGRLKGIEVDLIDKIADILNVRAKYVELSEKRAKTLLFDNKIDIVLDGSIKTLCDDNQLIFSKPYFYDKQVLLTQHNSKLDFTKSFENIRVGGLKNSTLLESFLEKKPKTKLILFSETFQLKKALEYNNVDAILLDSKLAEYFKNSSNNSFKVVDINLDKHPYQMAFDKKDLDLKNRIDSILDSL